MHRLLPYCQPSRTHHHHLLLFCPTKVLCAIFFFHCWMWLTAECRRYTRSRTHTPNNDVRVLLFAAAVSRRRDSTTQETHSRKCRKLQQATWRQLVVFYIHIYCCWCVGALGAHIQSVVAALDSVCASLSSSSFNYHENFRTYMISVLESFNTIMVNTMTLMMGMGEHTATHHTMRQQSMCLKGVVLDHYSTVQLCMRCQFSLANLGYFLRAVRHSHTIPWSVSGRTFRSFFLSHPPPSAGSIGTSDRPESFRPIQSRRACVHADDDEK